MYAKQHEEGPGAAPAWRRGDVRGTPGSADALRAIFEASPGGFAVLAGPDLRYVAVNDAYRGITARPELDPIGRTAAEVMPPEASARSLALARVLETGEPAEADAVERTDADGWKRTFSIRLRRIDWEGAPAVLVAAWETTAIVQAHHAAEECRARAERAAAAERVARLGAQRAAEEARRASELQQRLYGVVGHDLRTPLAAVQMAAALLSRRGDLSEEQARTVGRLAASAARMSALVRDLLDFSRLRREGAIPVQRCPVDLDELCRRAVAELLAVHPGRQIGMASRGSVHIEGDPERLLQVVSNLVGNAIQHGPSGTPVQVAVQGLMGAAAIQVHNAGPPIPIEILPDIFEPFRRGVRGPDDSGSVGLGLFIVREIVRAHGGDVSVASTAEEGTTFTVRLPRPCLPRFRAAAPPR